jgi:hypothetical protein
MDPGWKRQSGKGERLQERIEEREKGHGSHGYEAGIWNECHMNTEYVSQHHTACISSCLTAAAATIIYCTSASPGEEEGWFEDPAAGSPECKIIIGVL